MKGLESVVNGRTRADFGVIVSCSSADRSRRHTMHRHGVPAATIAEIAAEIDAFEGQWFIDAISTPDSVFRDVRQAGGKPYYVERQILGRIGRTDLLRTPRATDETDSTKRVGHAWRGKKMVVPKQAPA